MDFCISTRWNASRHTSGEAMIDEILALGLSHVELGYDLRIDLVPGVRQRVKEGAVTVVSVHNFCPVPVGAPRGHPELFTLAHVDPRVREGAVHHTTKTLRFAAEMGARVVVVHAGNVDMDRYSSQLCDLHEQGKQFDPIFEKTKLKLQITREKKAPRHLKLLAEGIEQLLPVVAETRVKLALENLPTWEAVPTEFELEELLKQYGDRGLACWHDIGHGQIRENLGFINAERWLERLQPWLAGMHIHDVAPPARDHLMPPAGRVDFSRIKRFASGNVLRVLEPAPQTPSELILEGLRFVRSAWADSTAADRGTEKEQ